MINEILEVFRSAGNWHFEASKAKWSIYLKGLDDKKLDILVELLQTIDVRKISLAELSGYIEMVSLEKLPNFERYGLDKNDARLYDNSWEQY